MRTNKFFFTGIMAVLALFSVACNDNLIEDGSDSRPGSRRITITAVRESDNPATKAHFVGNQLWWDVNDDISVLTYSSADQSTSANTHFTMVEQEAVQIAHFTGTIDGFVTGTSNDLETGFIWAMHPYQPQVYLSQGGQINNVRLIGKQTAQLGTFDPRGFVSGGWSPTFGITFQPFTSGIRFTIKGDNLPNNESVKGVKIRAVNGEKLGGYADVCYDGFDLSNPDDKIPHVLVREEESGTTVGLQNAAGFLTSGDATDDAANWYFILTWPQAEPVATLKFFLYTDTKVAITEVPGKDFLRAKYYAYRKIDEGLTWVDIPYRLETNYDRIAVETGESNFKMIVPEVSYGMNDLTANCRYEYILEDGQPNTDNPEIIENNYVSIWPQANGKCKVMGKAAFADSVRITVRTFLNTDPAGSEPRDVVFIPVYVYDDQFSVNPTTKIQFAPSNLQAWNSRDTVAGKPAFRFVNKSAFRCGSVNFSRPDLNMGTQYGYIDLFGWATGAVKSSKPTWLFVSDVESDYPNACNTSTDWGRNPIYNASTHLFEKATWRTPTKNNWLAMAVAGRMKGARSGNPTQVVNVVVNEEGGINGVVKCLVIFPDYYPSELFALPDEIRVEDIPAGLCVLPFAGVREVIAPLSGVFGYYWTADAGAENENPYSVKINDDGTIEATQTYGKHFGLPVRLVKTVH